MELSFTHPIDQRILSNQSAVTGGWRIGVQDTQCLWWESGIIDDALYITLELQRTIFGETDNAKHGALRFPLVVPSFDESIYLSQTVKLEGYFFQNA